VRRPTLPLKERNANQPMSEASRSVPEDRAEQLDRARDHLRKVDPVIGRLIDRRPDFDPSGWLSELPPMNLFGSLVFQVTGQQLSVAATRRTIDRLRSLFGGHLPSPQEFLAVEPGDLRAAGLVAQGPDSQRSGATFLGWSPER
jgi:3-methyladenine DNA glycosylase/8-oxoguanine DNA glycosylase